MRLEDCTVYEWCLFTITRSTASNQKWINSIVMNEDSLLVSLNYILLIRVGASIVLDKYKHFH